LSKFSSSGREGSTTSIRLTTLVRRRTKSLSSISWRTGGGGRSIFGDLVFPGSSARNWPAALFRHDPARSNFARWNFSTVHSEAPAPSGSKVKIGIQRVGSLVYSRPAYNEREPTRLTTADVTRTREDWVSVLARRPAGVVTKEQRPPWPARLGKNFRRVMRFTLCSFGKGFN